MYIRTLTILFTVLVSSFAQAEEWYAMERHGGCYSLAEANDHEYIFKGTKTPQEMEEKLKAERVDYTLRPLEPGMDGALTVSVPREGVSMLIVKKKYCKEFIER